MAAGVYPGSFDPLTIAHLAVAQAAVDQLGLARVDLAISVAALGKEHLEPDSVARRVAAIERAALSRPWLGVVVVTSRLVVDIAEGYDAVVMGADKWAQVLDPAWYGGVAERDAALARLPLVAVAPRGDTAPAPAGPGGTPGPVGVVTLDLDPGLRHVSSSGVRAGRGDWAAPGAGHR